MSLAKYFEDNIGLYEERMYYRNFINEHPNVSGSQSYRVKKKPEKGLFCPFCRMEFENNSMLVDHVVKMHGGRHDFV